MPVLLEKDPSPLRRGPVQAFDQSPPLHLVTPAGKHPLVASPSLQYLCKAALDGAVHQNSP
jgi:hypothetical protein